MEFLFKDFLEDYSKTFCFENELSFAQPSFFTWEDHSYQIFMQALLSKLEPRFEQAHTVLFNELDEVDEVCFYNQGLVDIGFEINRRQYWELRLRTAIIIGAYNVSFKRRTKFIYMTSTMCSGFSIRKSNWHSIMSDPDHKLLAGMLRNSVKKYYQLNILWKLTPVKEAMVAKWKKRADYQGTLVVQEHTPIGEEVESEEEDEDVECS